jgi:hypothetical protein
MCTASAMQQNKPTTMPLPMHRQLVCSGLASWFPRLGQSSSIITRLTRTKHPGD